MFQAIWLEAIDPSMIFSLWTGRATHVSAWYHITFK